MSELTLTLIKLGFLAVLWLFVLSVVSVIRSDLFGARPDRATARSQAKPAKPTKPPKPAKPRRGAPTRLVVSGGPNAGDTVPLDGPILIGRGADATVRLDDDYVSTRHARVSSNGDQWFVEDLGSTNGTYVGNRRVTSPTPIGPGIQVRVGKTVVELRK